MRVVVVLVGGGAVCRSEYEVVSYYLWLNELTLGWDPTKTHSGFPLFLFGSINSLRGGIQSVFFLVFFFQILSILSVFEQSLFLFLS